MTSKHFIFSYGTLASKRVRDKTGDSGEAIFCVLRGYQRRWNQANESGAFNSMGVWQAENTECIGMLIDIPYVELYKFDKRESGYRRIQLAADELFALSGKLPEGSYWLYIPLKSSLPTERSPIPQTMVDIMVQTYLEEGGEQLAVRFLASTLDWEFPWVNDRHEPLYSRYLEGMPHAQIDAFLKTHLPRPFDKRKEMLPSQNPELEESILKTLKYFDLFEFPLSAEEIMENLYSYQKPVHIKELKGCLKNLRTSGKVAEIKDFYTVAGREKNVETRKARKFIAEKLWARVNLYGQYLKAIPFVRMVAVCNNLAYNNPNENSDIDLFIVIKPGRMWLARFLITSILQFFGVRRHGEKIASRFCLSFFVTEHRLDMSPLQIDPQDPYLAYWVKTLSPTYGKATYEHFKRENEGWLKEKYGLNFSEKSQFHMHMQKESGMKHFLEWMFSGFMGNWLESLLQSTFKKKTLKSMEKLDSRANVVVTDDMLKFHNHDRRREYYEKWAN